MHGIIKHMDDKILVQDPINKHGTDFGRLERDRIPRIGQHDPVRHSLPNPILGKEQRS
jgi:hypothetical protein